MLRRIALLLFLAFPLGGLAAREPAPLPCASGAPSSFWINYSKTPNLQDLLAHDLVIVHPDATVPVEELHRASVQALAYISVVEIAPDAAYRDRVREARIPVMGRNPEWSSDLADVRSPAWRQFVVEQLAAPAAAKGYDGFFLDTAESLDLLIAKSPSDADALRAGLLQLVRDLRDRFPDRRIIINRGFRLQPDVLKLVDGVLVESLFQSYDFAKKKYRAVPREDTDWLLDKLKPAQADGLPVYVVDFVPSTNRQLAEKTVERIRTLGFHPLIADPWFEGPAVAPLRLVPNRVMVLYGKRGNVDEQGNAFYPSDTWTAQYFQMPLEWLGYEVDYYNAAALPPPRSPAGDCAAIMLDPWTQIGWSAQKGYADWIASQVRQGRKLLLGGSVPIEEPEARARLWRGLRVQARNHLPLPFSRAETLHIDDSGVMDGGEKIRAISGQYEGLQAPSDARVHLAVTVTPQSGKPFDSALVFTAPWGGAALDPGTFFDRPDHIALWFLDPFRFLAAALDCRNRPVPDPCTLTGRRVLISHIDGDGFSNRSQVERGRRSSEVIGDQILAKYPLPITVSIIEAEIRGHLVNQPPTEAEQLIAIARRIFALPNIEAASHTYSHPFYWIPNDHTADLYDAQSLELAPAHRLPKIAVRRETEGSIRFINDNLLPQGKRVGLMLWSGNCRPGPEALRLVRELGVENMNGGDTVISRQWPTLAMVSPRVMPWDGELQVRAGIQNEMLFTQSFRGPLYGGYVKVIQTFERTGQPRRLKPVDIYYHMCSGDRVESLDALKTVYDWAMGQPLRAVPASTYTRMVRSARSARVYQVAANEWMLSGDDSLQTFRMTTGDGVPDMAASRGLLGYCVEGGHLYLTLDGKGRAHVVLAPKPPPHLYLSASSAEIRFDSRTTNHARFRTHDLRPSTVVLGGLPPSQRAEVVINGRRSTMAADHRGMLSLPLPATAEVEVRAP